MKKKWMVALLTGIVVVSLSACNKLDVVGKTSISSFEKVMNIIPDQITEEESGEAWVLTAPDGMASFHWSKDYSQTEDYDVRLEVAAKPFLEAGLDASKLPEGMLEGDFITVGTNLSEDAITYEGDATPLKSYEQIVKLFRDNISYHTALDHYGVKLTNGNMFEWAKEMSTNDKDIVFVLNPEPFINAGVDPENVDGWTFAKVEMLDDNGKAIQVDKFLKPFELDGSSTK